MQTRCETGIRKRYETHTMEYNPDPSFAGVPLSIAEVEELAVSGAKALRSNASWMNHFLTRVIATMRSAQETRQQLEGAIERMKIDSQMNAGVNTTLSPLDAVRYLSPEHQRAIFDTLAKDRMDWLDLQAAEIEKKRRQVETVYNALVFIDDIAQSDPQIAEHHIIKSLRKALSAAKHTTDTTIIQERAPWRPIDESESGPL